MKRLMTIAMLGTMLATLAIPVQSAFAQDRNYYGCRDAIAVTDDGVVGTGEYANYEVILIPTWGLVTYGGSGSQIIIGTDGADEIHAGSGNDLVCSGFHQDLVYGDSGNDLLYSNIGRDEVHGGSGSDELRGGNEPDMLFGDSGNDIMRGAEKEDTCDGGTGVDTIGSCTAAD